VVGPLAGRRVDRRRDTVAVVVAAAAAAAAVALGRAHGRPTDGGVPNFSLCADGGGGRGRRVAGGPPL